MRESFAHALPGSWRVQAVRLLQEDRYRNCDYSCNGQLDEKGMKKYCALDRAGQAIMTEAYDRL